MVRHLRVPLALAICLLGASPAAPRQPPRASEPYPSPEETRREFDRGCRVSREGFNLFFGTAVVRRLEERLAQSTETAAEAILLRGRLGYELIRLGRLDQALAELESARVLLNAAPSLAPEAGHELLSWLAFANLQRAEYANCVALHSAASCILPFRQQAIHSQPENSRRAGDLFLELLEQYPDDLQARWLLNLSRMVTGDYPDGVPPNLRLPDEALAVASEFPLWINIASALEVGSRDLSGGAILDDFDGDGLLDLLSSTWDPCAPLKAFRNDGHGRFVDVTQEWGLDGQLGGLNIVHADFDNDGHLDLLVLRGAWMGVEGRQRNSLLRNDLHRGVRRFQDVTAAAGLAQPAYPTQTASWADYDGDGDLDLFVGNEGPVPSSTDPLQILVQRGDAYPSQLFRNDGDGTFTDIARAAGVANLRFAKGIAWGDYDNDGDPDLFISNIGPNRLYRNNGDSTFTDVAPQLGLDTDARTFATWFFDYDNDGDLDLFVNDYGSRVERVTASYLGLPTEGGHPTLYRNDGGRFTDVSAAVGLVRPLLVMGANYGDVDSDGWPDVYLGTGAPSYDALMPNVLYRNDEGRSFTDVTFASGLGHLQKGHGVAFGDIDNDGHVDLFQQLGGAFPYDRYPNALYLNPEHRRHWIVLRLEGRRANRFGVGARIRVDIVENGQERSIHTLVGTGGSFGGSSLQQEIGLGDAEGRASVTVVWPGTELEQHFPDVAIDRFYRLVEGRDTLTPLSLPRIPFPVPEIGALTRP